MAVKTITKVAIPPVHHGAYCIQVRTGAPGTGENYGAEIGSFPLGVIVNDVVTGRLFWDDEYVVNVLTPRLHAYIDRGWSPIFGTGEIGEAEDYRFSETQAVSSTVEDNLRALRARLRDFQGLSDNWDGYGGLPTTADAATIAENILSATNALTFELGVEASVGPLANGGLDLEWNSPARNELLIEIQPHGSNLNYVLSMRTPDDGFEDQSGRLVDLENISDLIRRLV